VRRAVAILVVPLVVVAAAAAKPRPVHANVKIALWTTHDSAAYGQRVTLRGMMVPAKPGAYVRISLGGTVFAHARVGPRGGFRLRIPARSSGPYRAGWYDARSKPVSLTLRPRLEATLVGSRVVGEPLSLQAQLQPSGGGSIRVDVFRDGRATFSRNFGSRAAVSLGTTSFGKIRVSLHVKARPGYLAVAPKTLQTRLLAPELRYGSTGPAVVELIHRLASLHYAVRTSSTYGSELVDSVIAFQKVQGIERDGVAGPDVWRRLANPRIPQPRYTSPADHLEVDKTHQVLYVVRNSKIAAILPTSTAGIAGYYTPEGAFSIYRKVDGFDNSPLGTLYKPMYFTGGYAVHGNPSVPPYPASHGCVRVPMWIADWMFETNDYGETVYVYS
jgi:peptidoglycan hydrolase-like protein with peptidoglycan-binding domain